MQDSSLMPKNLTSLSREDSYKIIDYPSETTVSDKFTNLVCAYLLLIPMDYTLPLHQSTQESAVQLDHY